MVIAPQFHKGAGLQGAALDIHGGRQQGRARRPQGLQRLFRLAVHQIDGGQIGRDLSLGHSVQPVLGLILQQLRRLIQQVDVDQAPRQPPHHLVAVGADRRQFSEVEEQGQRLHRLQTVRRAFEEQGAEGVVEIGLKPVAARQGDDLRPRRLQRGQGLAIAPLGEIKLAQGADHRQFGRIPAPAPFQRLQLGGGGVGLQRPLGHLQLDDAQARGRGDAVQRGARHRLVDRQSPVGLLIQFEQARLHQAGGQLIGGRDVRLAEDIGQQFARGVGVAGLDRRHRMGGAEARAPFGGEAVDHPCARREQPPRVGPVALLGRDIALPHLGRGIARQGAGREVGLRLVKPADGGAGGAAQAAHLGHALHGGRLFDQGVQHPDRLEPQTMPDQEAGIGQPRLDRGAQVFGGAAALAFGGVLQGAMAGDEAAFARIGGPVGRDQRRTRRRARRVGAFSRPFQPSGWRGQRQAARPCHRHQIAVGGDAQIVGRGLDRQAVGGRQEADVHRTPSGLQPLAGGQGGDGGEAVADHRIGQPDGAGRPGHARGQRRLDRVVALDVHAAGGGGGPADGHDPGRALGARGHGLTRLDRNAHGGEVRPGGPAGAVQALALHLHAGGVVEHGPDRLAAPEDGGADRPAPGETHHRLLALDLGRHRDRPADRHGRAAQTVAVLGRRIEVQPDGAVRGPAGRARPFGQGQDQFGRALGGAGLDLLQPLGRIDAQAADVGSGGRADADHDGAAVLTHPCARPDDPGELDPGEARIGADAYLDWSARLGQRRRRSQRREDDDARRGGRHGRLQNALLGGGPGHIARMLARRALIVVNGA